MITLTDGAREVVRSYMDQSDGECTALRISIAGGTTEVQKNIIAQRGLGLPR